MGSIIVINASREDVYCFVTRFNGGSDEWFKVRAGYRDSWGRRNGWELVAFTDADDTTRAGVYVRVNSIVTFRSFCEITVA